MFEIEVYIDSGVIPACFQIDKYSMSALMDQRACGYDLEDLFIKLESCRCFIRARLTDHTHLETPSDADDIGQDHRAGLGLVVEEVLQALADGVALFTIARLLLAVFALAILVQVTLDMA